jgi:hypothetical protein
MMLHGAGRGAFLWILLLKPADCWRRWPTKGINTMKTMIEQIEEEILAYDVSDEALEVAAGGKEKACSYTLGACTGLISCPA